MHGQTAQLSSIGLSEILDTSKCMSEIESPPLLKTFLLTIGIMSMALRILPTVPLEAYSRQSFWNTTCGGVALNGFDSCQLIGQNNQVFLPMKEREICLHVTVAPRTTVVQIEHFSSFDRSKRVTAWAMRLFTIVIRGRKIS